jgi:hypothetical protein
MLWDVDWRARMAGSMAKPQKEDAMGYDLHITRKAQWSDEDGPMIGQDEWLRIIETDPELMLDRETHCSIGEGDVVYASWKGEPGALGWFEGEIGAKNPDKALVLKMVGIAERLGAKVQGDDGEEYPESLEPADASRNAPWWRRLFRQ